MRFKIIPLVLIMIVMIGALISDSSIIPDAHASYSLSAKSPAITATDNVYQFDWSYQLHTFYANGQYWGLYHTGLGTCGGAQSLCLYALRSADGQAWGWPTGTTGSVPSNTIADSCGNYFSGGSTSVSLSSTTNGTFIFITCDYGADIGFGNPSAGALYFVEGKLNTNGSITWQPRRQVVAGQGCTTGGANCFQQEVIKVSSDGRVFISYDLSTGAGKNHPFVVQSTDHDGVTWSAPLQLSSIDSSCCTLGYGWEVHLFTFSDTKMLVTYAIFTGDTSTHGGTLYKQRLWSGSIWGPETVTGITDKMDGSQATEDGINTAWMESPSPLGDYPGGCVTGCTGGSNDWGSTCGWQDCGEVSWTYSELTNTWGDRAVIDPTHYMDEHGELFYDSATKTVYKLFQDNSCIFQTNPATIYIWRKTDPRNGPWGTRTILVQPSGTYAIRNGYFPGISEPGCTSPTDGGSGSFAGGWTSYSKSANTTTYPFFVMEITQPGCIGPKCVYAYQLSLSSDATFTRSESKQVLFLDDFINGNPLLSSSWTIDNYATSGTIPGEYTSGGFAAMVAQSSSSVETIHVSTAAAYSPSAYSNNMIVKRKLTASLFPFQKSELNTANIRVGIGPLLTTGAYPGSTPYGTPNVDYSNNCGTSPNGADNIGIEYVVMDNGGAITAVTCGDGGSNRVGLFGAGGLDPTLYTVFTVVTSGIYCSTCLDNTFSGSSWVWFRVYQNDKNGAIIASTDKSINFTASIAPLAGPHPMYIFASLQNNNGAATHQTSYIDLVQLQNYGSPVCLFGCLPPVIEVGNLPPPLSSIWAGLVNLAAALGQGDIGFGSMILFGIFTLPVILTYAATRSTMLVASEFLAILGLLMASGLFGSIWVFGVVLSMGYLAFGIIKKMFLSGGMGGGGSGEGDG